MTDFVAIAPVWVVLAGLVELVAVDTGQQFTSAQVCEQYDTEAEAHARMVELDPDWTPDPDLP